MRLIHFLDEHGKRFPAWDHKVLGDIAKIVGGGTPATNAPDYWNGNINWFSPTEIGGVKHLGESVKKITKLGLRNSSAKIHPPGTVLLTTRASLGRMGILSCEAATNQGFQSLIPNGETTSEFLYYLQPKIEAYCAIKASGSTFKEISGKEIAKMPVNLPTLPEQKKIAEFFSALDARIDLQAQKVALLKEQKRGYQQRVFNGDMAFTDDNGNAYPAWEEKKLGKIADVNMGQSPAGSSYSEDSNETILIQGNADMKNGKVVPRIYTSEGTKFCKPGDIIMSVRAPVGALARSNVRACLGRGVCAISGPNYLFYYLSHLETSRGWSKISQGSTFEAVSSKDVVGMTVPFPSLSEQEKIAEFFFALDESIDFNESKLELLKDQKNGYLQGVFG